MLLKNFAATVLCNMVFYAASQFALAQTIDGDILRGQGRFAEGAGWYNLNTAKANAININAMRAYNEEVRLNYRNMVMSWAEKREGKKLSTEEAQKRADARLEELRNNPSNDDIRSGEAINVLVAVLSDPDIDPKNWQGKAVELPGGATIKDIVFHHYPKKMGPNEMKVLVSLSRLGKDIEWPIYLNNTAFDSEREAYVAAVSKVKQTLLGNKFEPSEIKALNSSLDKLKAKIDSSLDSKGGYRSQGKEFYFELTNATKLFDADNIDWAKYVLQETDQYEATTVEQLIAFMRQYRLMFATAPTPRSTKLYNDLFVSMKKQASEFGVQQRPTEPVSIDAKPKSTDHFAVGSVWHGAGFYTIADGRRIRGNHKWRLQVSERNGERFTGTLNINEEAFGVNGTATISDTGTIAFQTLKTGESPLQHAYKGELNASGKVMVSFSGRGGKHPSVTGKVELQKLVPNK